MMGLKELKRDLIVNQALDIFMKRSISDVKIKDIASEIGVGEATIYRYFSTKDNLIMLCAQKLENIVYEKYFNLSKFHTGFEKIKEFYSNYLYIFNSHPEYYRFIQEFDSMVLPNDYDKEEYESLVDKFYLVFIEAYNEGISDNSIKEIKDIDIFYYSTSKSLLELCKKESIEIDLLRQDKIIDKKKIIQKLIDIFLLTFKR